MLLLGADICSYACGSTANDVNRRKAAAAGVRDRAGAGLGGAVGLSAESKT